MSDDRNVPRTGRQSPDEQLRLGPLGASEPGEGARREAGASSPVKRADAHQAPGEPPPFRRIPNGSAPRRGPSYPAWEKAPTPFNFPRLHGGRSRNPLWLSWPAILGGIGAVLVVLVVVIAFALRSQGGNAAGGSPSASATSYLGGSPGSSAASAQSAGPEVSGGLASPSAAGGPSGPHPSYRQYEVQAGDTLSRIAKKFGLKLSELLAANPDLSPTSILRIGLTINVPQPGQVAPATAAPASAPEPS